jgi:hypothetical protein
VGELEGRGIGYVLTVACDHSVLAGGDAYPAEVMATRVPARAWKCVSAGTGAKGHRHYDWAFIRLDDSDPPHGDQPAAQHWLLVRRNRKTGARAYCRC